MNARLIHSLACRFVLACCMTNSLLAFAQENANQVFTFATGWRTDRPQDENVLQLGVVYQCSSGSGWCMEVEEYSGKLNLPRQKLAYRHNMRADTNAEGCTDEYMTTVKGARPSEQTVQLKKTDSGYSLEAGKRTYQWKRDQGTSGGYLLVEAGAASGGPQYSQVVGYGYWSDDDRSIRFERSQYNAYFDGNLAHKDTQTGVADDWKMSRTSIDFRKYVADAEGTPAIHLTTPGAPEVLKRMKKPVGVHLSLLPPENKTSGERLRIFNHEYGHDFNADGCFDEFGHNKMMLPIVAGDQVRAFVFVEYTYDKFDGVPMLSVGRYFRKQ